MNNRSKKTVASLLIAGSALLVSACGGGSSSTPVGSSGNGGSGGGGADTPNTGVFLDSAVANIGYKTATQQGTTNAIGEYSYIDGEMVTFFIGDLELPPVTASGVVTPLEIAQTDDVENAVVVNMIRLLQSLDEDGNPENGITITEVAKQNATPVDFSLAKQAFAESIAVSTLIANSGSPVVTIISEEDALAHFEETLTESFTIDLTTAMAISQIEAAGCPNVYGGWDYTFTDTGITLSGSDTWNNCVLGTQESFTVNILNQSADFDIPFNCTDFPICTASDFNKVIEGIDEDDRSFTSTYTFDRGAMTITYVKTVHNGDAEEFSEVIKLYPNAIVVEWQETITAYTKGQGEDGFQCDLDRDKQIGDMETFDVLLSRAGSNITATELSDVHEGDLYDTWPYDYDSDSKTLSYMGEELEVDPTGQLNDPFTNVSVIDESITWNPSSAMFIGYFEEDVSLSKEGINYTSDCSTTYALQLDPISSEASLNAFLGD